MRTTWSASFWTIWMIEISCCLQLMISKHIFSNIEMAIWLVRQKLTEGHEKKDTRFDFSIKSTYKKLEFFVNGMLALELRYRDLISNGVGFYTYGAQVADFDDLELIQ